MKTSRVSPFSNLAAMALGDQVPVALPDLDVADSDVPDLVLALGRGSGQPRGRVLVDFGGHVVDEECQSHAETPRSYRSVTDAPARSLSRRS